jgi:hypothetical protein
LPSAAEELIYGPEEMSTMQQRRLIDARRIVQKLVVSAAMTENPAIGPRTISVPRRWVAERLVLWCGACGGCPRSWLVGLGPAQEES